METWQSNLENLLGNHGHFRLKELNDRLYSWSKIWVNDVDRFDNFKGGLSLKYPYQVQIEVKKKGYMTTAFYCNLEYAIGQDSLLVLEINSVIGFDYGGYLRKINGTNIIDYYQWQENVFSGEEIFHQGFALENLNMALEKFMPHFEQ